MRIKTLLLINLLLSSILLADESEVSGTKKEFSMTNKLYKVLRAKEWEAASNTGKIITDLDNVDGFIHLSTALQLATTLSFFFEDSDEVFLLQLDLGKIDNDKLLFEAPHPNEGKRKSAFPHLYSELRTNQISNIWVLGRSAFNLPEDVLLQAENLKTN